MGEYTKYTIGTTKYKKAQFKDDEFERKIKYYNTYYR